MTFNYTPTVSIIGGGVAGLSTALYLHQAGIDVAVFERIPRYSKVGHAFLLLENGLASLDQIGVGREVRARGYPIERVALRTPDTKVLADTTLSNTICISRAVLLESLRHALPAGILRKNMELGGLDRTVDGRIASARFRDGSRSTSRLFIGADGVRSQVRQALFPGAQLSKPRVYELVCSARSPELVRALGHDLIKTQSPDVGLALGVVPSSVDTIVWYLQFDVERWQAPDASADAKRQFASSLVGRWPEPIPRLLAGTDFTNAYVWPTTDLDSLPAYHLDNVLLVGDAGHPMLTFTSQGANAAFEDAVAITRHIAPALRHPGGPLEASFLRYTALRRPILEEHLRRGREQARCFLEGTWWQGDLPLSLGKRISHSSERRRRVQPSFSDSDVNIALLRQRAYNLRWAVQPDGVIPLTAADPDFPVAPEIRAAVETYVASGVLSYGPPEGLPEFREAVARKMVAGRNVPCSPAAIVAVDSAASGMYVVARHAMRPGDEAIIFDPVDFLFQAAVEAAGGTVRRVPISARGDIDIQAVQALITPRTRMLGLCNPINPVGRVLTRSELAALGALAVSHDMWIMADEIWSDIVYAPHCHVSMAALAPELAARTFTVHGFSKSYGLAGLRVGFIVAPDPTLAGELRAISGAMTTAYGVSTLSQIAAAAALDHCEYWLEAFVRHLTSMRDLAVQRLNAIEGVTCMAPAGTYVLFPSIRGLGMSAEQVAEYLLREARVAVVPGSARWFGPGAEGHIRLCFSTSEGILTEALNRIGEALAKL